jgi:anti-anti-sigma factor
VSTTPPSTITSPAFQAVSFPRTADAPAKVVVAGELDISGVAQMDRALRRAERDGGPLVVDMHELEFLDSSGVRLLLVADLRLRRTGRRLILRGVQADVRWCLELIGADQRLDLD